MANSKAVAQQHVSVGEHAVDGLSAGIGAGILLALYVVLAGLTSGEGPAQVLSRCDPRATPSPVMGTIAHLTVAGIYGLLFGAVARWIARGGRLNALFSSVV